MKCFFVCLILSCLCWAEGEVAPSQSKEVPASPALNGRSASPNSVEMNKEGVELLKKQNYSAAQEKFAQGLVNSPYSAELQVNLGLAFDGAGNKEKAAQAYELAAKTAQDKNTRFAANFNLAEMAGRDKKVDEALKYYQRALQDDPDSVEAKTNIELLTQNQQDGKKGEKDNKDKDGKDNKDKKQDQKQDQNKDQKDKKDGQDQKDQDKNQGSKDQDKDQNKKEGYQKDKPQPQKFKSEELTQGDVNRILDELNRQEQRVRAEYNKKQIKERPRDKDW